MSRREAGKSRPGEWDKKIMGEDGHRRKEMEIQNRRRLPGRNSEEEEEENGEQEEEDAQERKQHLNTYTVNECVCV